MEERKSSALEDSKSLPSGLGTGCSLEGSVEPEASEKEQCFALRAQDSKNPSQAPCAMRIDIYDSFNLIDMMNKAPYKKKNINEAINDLKRCLVYCISAPPVYMIKTYDPIDEVPKVSYVSEMVAKQILNKIVVKRKTGSEKYDTTAWRLFLNNQLEFTVKAIKFYSEDEQVFNYFRGYDYQQLDEVKEEIIKPFLDHIHDVIANKNEEVYKYILVWIASILQKPNFKTGTALVILGNQGTGKNVFTNVICKLMARYANENITSIESVVGKFNAVLENKKLLVLNELQSIDANKYLNSDALKSVITDYKININQKNEPERLTENVANFIMVSNNNIPIKIEATDRRYMVTKTSDDKRGDFEYFDKLCDSFTSEFYENLFTFFMMLDINNYNLRKIPTTESKEDIKEASMSSYELFIREYYERINDITGPDMFNLYNEFIEKYKFRECSSRTFISNMKQFTGNSKPKRIDGKVYKVYNLLPEVYNAMKKYNDELEAKIIDEVPDDAF